VLTPILLDRFGPHVAFAVPGILMGIATVVFWAGRNRFVHVPPRGREFLREITSRESLGAIGRLAPIYICIAAFWCLFDQTASAWVLQAEHMDRKWLGVTWLSSQLQAVNPAMILILVPIFSYVIYPIIDSVWSLTPLRKIGIGMFLTVPAFVVSALIERSIEAGNAPSVGWQVLAYVILTAAEVMVSITSLEFSYTQAPRSVKSIVMSVYLLSVSLGNELTAVVNAVIQNPDGTTKLPGASYYWFFTAVMAAAAVAYVFVASFYRGETYIQPQQGALPERAAADDGQSRV
jgi:proton-dependent oligopeptide transporter, POT family